MIKSWITRRESAKPKLELCPDCNATGHSDKVFRGMHTNPDKRCDPCIGRGWRVLNAGEQPGKMGINLEAVG